MPVVERIRELMGGLSIPAFAAHIGEEKPQRLKDVLTGRQRVPEDMLIRILERTGCDANWLLLGTPRSKPELTARQQALLDNYAHADDEGKKVIEGTANLAAQSASTSGRNSKAG